MSDKRIAPLRVLRGRAEVLAKVNPVLEAGEPCLELDTGKFKFGIDGVKTWNELPYVGGSELPDDGETVYVVQSGEYVEATAVDMSASWSPDIDNADIVLAVDEDMAAYQLTGINVEVNA